MTSLRCFFAVVVLVVSLVSAAQAVTLKLAYAADPVSLDPHEQLSGGTLQFSHMVFDPLVRWTKDQQIEPRLAESWQRIDAYTLRFKLRQGVRFHTGNELTSEDVRWTLERLQRSVDFKPVFAMFEKVRVIDQYTFDLITRNPYPLALQTATYIFPMDSRFYTGVDEKGLPKALLRKHGNTFASKHLSGTGPYLVSHRQQGVRVEFDRFADYWDRQSQGNVSRIILTPIKSDPTRVAALLSGDVDVISPVPPNDHVRIRNHDRLDLVTLPSTRIITLQLNQQRRKEFRDLRVRQAIVNAINNEGIVKKIMKGFATAAGQQSPKSFVGHKESLKPRYDLKRARQLMKEAGYESGFSVTMVTPNNRYVNDAKIARAVVSMLAKINIQVDLRTIPKAQFWAELDARSADIMMVGWRSDTEDSANFSEFLIMCPNPETGAGQYNSGSYCNPEVDRLVMQSSSEIDKDKRRSQLQKVEQILYDDAAFVPLHWQKMAWGVDKKVKIEPVLNVMNLPYLGDLVVTE
ncbi:ABC transporter substrate-binding protein [Motiliproteus sp. MSK22-1]|uniref:ABC transporter substrate-binding protein n=1 Tax=Motiliproteus sp. MSK22-1 TaxID=1897630 RepID=UPI0009789390|nr:ABC transporter substrate-binding protein [Motiliproteus sp. MSK22-1]OMH38098.1 nickel/dipeptide/oligopeptide ABC transporter substrate-binding protein [Motiliproteus sp. MSK22-1]